MMRHHLIPSLKLLGVILALALLFLALANSSPAAAQTPSTPTPTPTSESEPPEPVADAPEQVPTTMGNFILSAGRPPLSRTKVLNVDDDVLNENSTVGAAGASHLNLVPLPPDSEARIAFDSDRDGDFEIYVMNADGSNVTQLTHNYANDLVPDWSPDGGRIMFPSDRDGDWEIYVMNVDGSNVIQLTHDSATDFAASWSPDGGRIVFYSDRDGDQEIYVMDANGSNVIQLTHNSATEYDPRWSPDGERIAFSSNRDGRYEIYVMDVDGSDVIQLTHNSIFSNTAAWSPGGERIAFHSIVRSGYHEIFVMDSDGSNARQLTHYNANDVLPHWSPDGRHMAFTSDRDGDWEIYVMNADGSDVKQLTHNRAIDIDPRWSPTGGSVVPPPPNVSTISYVFQNFHVIPHDLDEYGNGDAECKLQLGNQYRLADWNDLKLWVDAGGSVPDLITGLRLSWEGVGDPPSIYPHDGNGIDVNPRVSRDGQPRWNDGRRHFFISRHDHVRPGYFLAHDHIDNYHISLGSWYSVGGTLLCYSDTASPPTPNAFVHNPALDFNTLIAAGNRTPEGIWSDGTTAWVSDPIDQKIYAYNLATRQRHATGDFDTLSAAGNRNPHGIWSDGTTMWVAHNTNDTRSKLYAYNLATKQHDSAKDINALAAAGNHRPDGIWSDGTTMWVADWADGKLYAYNLTTKQRDSAKDFDTLAAAGNNNPDGIWSDGTTVWVSDPIDQKIYAYNMSTKRRDSAKDFNTLAAAGNNNPADMWSDGTTLWVTDWGDGKIYAYNMPPSSVVTPPPSFSLSIEASREYANIVSVEAGQSFDLTVRMHDVRGAGEQGGISVSFPQLTGGGSIHSHSSDVADVELVSYTTVNSTADSIVTFYQPDDTIYQGEYLPVPFEADYLLAEADDPSWSQGDEGTLTLRITPKQQGEFRILVRGWICTDGYTNCSRNPTSSDTPDTDQQGWPVRELVINVSASSIPVPIPPDEEPALRATLESCGVGDRDPHMGFYQPGDIVRLSATAVNYTAFETELLSGKSTRSFLYVVFKFWGNNGILGESTSETREVFESADYYQSEPGEKHEFAIRVPDFDGEVSRLPVGTTAIQCLLYFDGQTSDVLEDFSGRDDGASNGYVTIDEDPVHAERLKFIEYRDREGGGWMVDVSVSPPMTANSGARNLTITVEREGKFDLSGSFFRGNRFRDNTLEQFVATRLRVPETVWVDYEAITKWIANTDGIYEQYTYEMESETYQENAFGSALFEAILAFFPTLHQIYAVVSSTLDILDARNIQAPTAGVNPDNCRDNVSVVTLTPSVSAQSGGLNVIQLPRLSNSPKRLQVEIPMYSLAEDDHISLRVLASDDISPSDDTAYLMTLTDLLNTGRDAPSCNPPSDTSPPPVPPLALDSCIDTLADNGVVNGRWTAESDCVSANRDRDGTSGAYVRYYAFRLTQSADVVITLESEVDTYLYLLRGTGRDGEQEADNDDHASEGDCTADLDRSTDSCIVESLDAGNYTIEATTYYADKTGDFTLTVEGLPAGVGR